MKFVSFRIWLNLHWQSDSDRRLHQNSRVPFLKKILFIASRKLFEHVFCRFFFGSYLRMTRVFVFFKIMEWLCRNCFLIVGEEIKNGMEFYIHYINDSIRIITMNHAVPSVMRYQWAIMFQFFKIIKPFRASHVVSLPLWCKYHWTTQKDNCT